MAGGNGVGPARRIQLVLQLAEAGSVHGGEGRTGGGQSLRIGDAAGGTEDAEKLVALATDAAEEAQLLKNHAPGDDRENQQDDENHAGDPARLAQDVAKVGD